MRKPLKSFYFNKFENRKPYQPIPDSGFRTLLFQFCGIVTVALGCAYLHWRWAYSLNMESLWFAFPLVLAETLSFIGTLLIIFNFWSNRDPRREPPPRFLSEIEDLDGKPDRPIRIDVHIATYNEDVELVRYSIRDAIDMRYPHGDVEIKVYVLDDGRRDGRDPAKQNMKQVAEEEGASYLTRESNEGYKAGNLKNGLEKTNGDIFVILDADTRPFPGFLENVSGYFRDKKVAWVQTPQWFYDTTEPLTLSQWMIDRFGIRNGRVQKAVSYLFGSIRTGEDIFGNDPRLFYDVILRRRNYYNAAFCCGAGSVHRREAVMRKAVKDFVEELRQDVSTQVQAARKENMTAQLMRRLRMASFLRQDVKPFKFHASEDIYTSMMMHSDPEGWISIQHAGIECRMLSPQDLDSCVKQRTRYASGSLDIAFKDNPFRKKGLSLVQRLCYFNTIWSYFAPLWIIVFLLAPVVYFFTHALPVQAYSFDFFKFFLPFQIMNTVTITLGTWGIATGRGEQYYISSFWFMLKSILAAVKGEKVTFNVTPKEKQRFNNNMQHIWPHLAIMALTLLGIGYNLVLIALDMHPSISGFFANSLWALANMYSLSIMLRAAYWTEEEEQAEEAAVEAVKAGQAAGENIIGQVALSPGTQLN
jgi:cellulose synthase (UDP-forming)